MVTPTNYPLTWRVTSNIRASMYIQRLRTPPVEMRPSGKTRKTILRKKQDAIAIS